MCVSMRVAILNSTFRIIKISEWKLNAEMGWSHSDLTIAVKTYSGQGKLYKKTFNFKTSPSRGLDFILFMAENMVASRQAWIWKNSYELASCG